MKTRSHGCFWLLGGGVKACCRAGFGWVGLVEKFRSLEVEKDLIIILSAETSLFTPDAQLARSPRPLWERAEFVSEPCELRNSGEGLKNYHSNHYPPTPFGYCLGFAPRAQNLTFGAELLSVRFARYPDYLTNVRVVRPQIRFPRKGGAEVATLN